MIVDCLPPNFIEGRLNWLELPSAAQLQRIVLEEAEVLLVSGEDLECSYHFLSHEKTWLMRAGGATTDESFGSSSAGRLRDAVDDGGRRSRCVGRNSRSCVSSEKAASILSTASSIMNKWTCSLWFASMRRALSF